MPKKITICGSMQFANEMLDLKQDLESMGWAVFAPDSSEISELSKDYFKLPKKARLALKKEFITAHFNKIKESDAILVANYNKNNIIGYIGPNTLMEIAIAHILDKEIFILNELGQQKCLDEVEPLASKILTGNIFSL